MAKPKYAFESDGTYVAFRESIRSPDTLRIWTNFLHNYMVISKIDRYSALLLGDIKTRLIAYVQEKKKQGVRGQSIGSQLTAFRHFYWINGVENIDVILSYVRAYLPEAVRAVADKPYTHAQIKQFLTTAKPRIRIVIYSEAQGGPRIGAFPTIKKGDLTRTPHGFYRVLLYRGTTAEYASFFGPEATKEVDDYFAYRERCGEVLTDESPLIREEFDPAISEIVRKPRFVSRGTLVRQISDVAVAAGLRKVEKGAKHGKRNENMLTHGLRKFFRQQCRRAGVDPIVTEYLMGHKNGDLKYGISKLMMTYDPADEDELLKEYLKAVDYLTINDEHRLKRQVQEKSKENDVLRQELADIIPDVINLKATVEELKKRYPAF
jgi:hypothetical protein